MNHYTLLYKDPVVASIPYNGLFYYNGSRGHAEELGNDPNLKELVLKKQIPIMLIYKLEEL